MKRFLAVDIGASSGRHIIGSLQDGKMNLKEVYRFTNSMVEKNGHLCWEIGDLFNHIVEGMKVCAQNGEAPDFMAIDTWGVDFVLLDGEDKMVGDSVGYRDSRTEGVDVEVEKIISFDDLYLRTGIQKQPFNTIYQLMALKLSNPEYLEKAENLLFIPDYFNFLLTGVKKQEYTFSSTSSLISAKTNEWDMDLIEMLGFNPKLFKEITKPGGAVGSLRKEIKEMVGFDCEVVLAASHDTASAYLSVPARDDKAVYISSGTWSLLGVESMKPIISEAGRDFKFTNEGGYGYRYRFLRNIMGLWMIQSIRREHNNDDKKYSFAELEEMAKASADFKSVVDVNDLSFFAPESMSQAVRNFCVATNQPIPETLGQLMQCVYISLAKCYADSVDSLEEITGNRYTSINIVGGGSKDTYLNSLTAKASGRTVFAGPTEGTVIGNLIVQMIHGGEISDLAQARQIVKNSFEIKEN